LIGRTATKRRHYLDQPTSRQGLLKRLRGRGYSAGRSDRRSLWSIRQGIVSFGYVIVDFGDFNDALADFNDVSANFNDASADFIDAFTDFNDALRDFNDAFGAISTMQADCNDAFAMSRLSAADDNLLQEFVGHDDAAAIVRSPLFRPQPCAIVARIAVMSSGGISSIAGLVALAMRMVSRYVAR
jgi:hypothetical protein